MDDRTRRRPLVDDDVHGSVTKYLKRVLEKATPESWVAGGASDSAAELFNQTPRTYDKLTEHEAIYENGGPITTLIDDRALMTYGTGVEFQSDADVEDAQGRTVDEWLNAQFGEHLDLLMIDAGIQAYWAGDAWPEIVETRAGEFSHVDLLDPVTVDADWDRHGEITEIQQVIVEEGKVRTQPVDEEMVGHFTFKRSSGGPLGPSLIEQNRDEIKRFARNQEQRANAIALHGSPKYDVSVGSEGQSIPDRIMRRIRNKFRPENVDELTTWTHGGDIEIETLESPGFEGMGSVTETDARMLAQGFGIPLEWTNFGADGLGSGKPAESRQTKFERRARAEQRRRTAQFIDLVRVILERYSPFPRDVDVSIVFGDVVSDQQAQAEWLQQVGWAYHRDEIREKMDDMAWDESDDREAPPELAPATQDAAAAEGGTGDESPGLFQQARERDTDFSERRSLLHDSISDGELTQEELVFEQIYEDVLWPQDDDRQLFEFDPEEVPDFVVERLQEAVRDGGVFNNFETIPDWAAGEVEDVMLDSLEKRHGWSVDSIAQNLQDMALGLDKKDAVRIARTETQSLVNHAREAGYEDRADFEDLRFNWVGPDDTRNSDACPWIKSQIPDDGVTLDRLKELVQEANDRFVDHAAREWTPHINCRHTYARVI